MQMERQRHSKTATVCRNGQHILLSRVYTHRQFVLFVIYLKCPSDILIMGDLLSRLVSGSETSE